MGPWGSYASSKVGHKATAPGNNTRSTWASPGGGGVGLGSTDVFSEKGLGIKFLGSDGDIVGDYPCWSSFLLDIHVQQIFFCRKCLISCVFLSFWGGQIPILFAQVKWINREVLIPDTSEILPPRQLRLAAYLATSLVGCRRRMSSINSATQQKNPPKSSLKWMLKICDCWFYQLFQVPIVFRRRHQYRVSEKNHQVKLITPQGHIFSWRIFIMKI